MQKKWIIGVMVSLILILILVFWQAFNPNSFKLDANQTHIRSMEQKHLLSIIQLNEKLKNSSECIVIDLRTEEDYNTNPIYDAVNIPFANVLNSQQLFKFKTDDKEIILYSGSLIESTQAWTLLTQMGFQNLFILDTEAVWIQDGTLIASGSGENNEVLKYKFQADTTTNLELNFE